MRLDKRSNLPLVKTIPPSLKWLALVAASWLATATAHADPLIAPTSRELAPGHRKKVAGAALIGVGSALALAGQILFLHAGLSPLHTTDACAMGHPDCNHDYLNPLELVPGGVLVGVGGALLLTGIPLYAIGGAERRRAERPTLALLPQVTLQGASLSASIRF